jgi:hypothetical protein
MLKNNGLWDARQLAETNGGKTPMRLAPSYAVP